MKCSFDNFKNNAQSLFGIWWESHFGVLLDSWSNNKSVTKATSILQVYLMCVLWQMTFNGHHHYVSCDVFDVSTFFHLSSGIFSKECHLNWSFTIWTDSWSWNQILNFFSSWNSIHLTISFEIPHRFHDVVKSPCRISIFLYISFLAAHLTITSRTQSFHCYWASCCERVCVAYNTK